MKHTHVIQDALSPDEARAALANQEKLPNENLEEATQESESSVEGLPDNFKSVEDLAKSFKELQAEYTKLKQNPSEKSNEPQNEDTTSEEADNTPVAMTRDDIMNYSKEFQENGELSDNSYQALTQVFGNDIVDAFVSQGIAKSEKAVESVQNVLGGEDAYSAAVQWASENMDRGFNERYNKVLESGDVNTALDYARILKSQYVQATGDEKQMIQGKASKSNNMPYESQKEYLEDIRNPLYKETSKRGERYRESVHKRLSLSDYLGF